MLPLPQWCPSLTSLQNDTASVQSHPHTHTHTYTHTKRQGGKPVAWERASHGTAITPKYVRLNKLFALSSMKGNNKCPTRRKTRPHTHTHTEARRRRAAPCEYFIQNVGKASNRRTSWFRWDSSCVPGLRMPSSALWIIPSDSLTALSHRPSSMKLEPSQSFPQPRKGRKGWGRHVHAGPPE